MPRRRRRRQGRPGRILLSLGLVLLLGVGAWALVRPGGRDVVLALGQSATHALEQVGRLLPRTDAPAARPTPTRVAPTPPARTTTALAGAGPNRVSRAQLAELLTTAFGLTPSDIGPVFTDIRASTPGAAAIEAAAGAGDFGQAPGGRFRPAAPVTRLVLAQALVGALGLGPEAARMNGQAPAVADAGTLPESDWGTVRIVTALGLLPAVHGDFEPGVDATPGVVQAALAAARSVSGIALGRVLGALATSVTAVATPDVVEPGQSVSLSAVAKDGELALPVAVRWSASGGTLAGGVFVPADRDETAVLSASVSGARRVGRALVQVEVPARLVAVRPPSVVLADQAVVFSFAVVRTNGETVSADNGRRVTIRLTPPSGGVVTRTAVDRDGQVTFDERPSVLGVYRLEADSAGLGTADVHFSVVPGSLGSLSLLSNTTALAPGERLSLATGVLATPGSGRVPKTVPVTMTAVLDGAGGSDVPVGSWQGSAASTSLTGQPVPLASVGPFAGPATLVVTLTSPGGAFLPAQISVPVAGSGSLQLLPAERAVTAGDQLLVTATANASAGASFPPVPLTLSITAPDGGPLAPMRQILDHGRAQFLLPLDMAGTYRLAVSGSGFTGATTQVTVRPGRATSLLALLPSPFASSRAGLSLRVWAVDAHRNPLTTTAPIRVVWRFRGRRGAPWHRVAAESGATIPLPAAPPGSDCSVAVRLEAPSLALRAHQILPCTLEAAPAASIAGTGIFLSYWVARDASAAGIVDQAVRDHVHTLYVEVAIPGTGFWGEPGLDRLLAPAHAAGLAVIAWVPANLGDPARDTAAARAALTYTTPLGQRVDGLAADFEGQLGARVVLPYLRAVRAAAGAGRVVAAVADPPTTSITVPYALFATYANVLMPMDYWQNSESLDTYADAYRAVASAVALVRSEAPGSVVEPVLQAYDPFAPGGTGVYNPEPLAEDGALGGARAAGALGAAFFQWGTLTNAEWRVVAGAGTTPF